MMTKFKVGDKVRIIRAGGSTHENGDIGIIVSLTPFHGKLMHDVVVGGETQGHYESDIELVESTPTKKQRIKALEAEVVGLTAEVAELKAKVEALEKPQVQPKFVPVTTDNVAVGDEIRVINLRRIDDCNARLIQGGVYVVFRVDSDGDFYVKNGNYEAVIVAEEFPYVEKVVSE